MDVDTKSLNRWGKPLNIGLFGLAALVVIAVGFYLSVFNNGLSPKSDSWSNFGSFFGGLIGPGISLVTLIALLRTIDLQLEQSAHFVEEGSSARLSEYKASQLRLLDQQILMYDRMIDRYEADVERISLYSRNTGTVRTADLNSARSNLEGAEREIKLLIQLSVMLSLDEFKTLEELRTKVQQGLRSINPNLYDLT